MMHRYILTVTYPSITVDYKAGGGGILLASSLPPSPAPLSVSGSRLCDLFLLDDFLHIYTLYTRVKCVQLCSIGNEFTIPF